MSIEKAGSAPAFVFWKKPKALPQRLKRLRKSECPQDQPAVASERLRGLTCTKDFCAGWEGWFFGLRCGRRRPFQSRTVCLGMV